MDSCDYQKLVEKYDQLKRNDLHDLSADQDLVLAIMNLISIEEHMVFTGAKTERPAYYQLIPEVRKLRKQLLQQVIKEYEGEVWCISKHLLAASYRLLEVGSKQMDLANEQLANSYYEQSYQLYNLFWGLVMKIIPSDGKDFLQDCQVAQSKEQEMKAASEDSDVDDSESVMDISHTKADQALSSNRDLAEISGVKKNSWQRKLRDMVQRLVNCCIE